MGSLRIQSSVSEPTGFARASRRFADEGKDFESEGDIIGGTGAHEPGEEFIALQARRDSGGEIGKLFGEIRREAGEDVESHAVGLLPEGMIGRQFGEGVHGSG